MRHLLESKLGSRTYQLQLMMCSCFNIISLLSGNLIFRYHDKTIINVHKKKIFEK